ncbi:MAG: hypothetical protein ACM31D_00595 [Bacteroidota bacterium]
MPRLEIIAAALVLLLAQPTLAQTDKVDVSLASECTTDPVSASGKGHTCYADNPTCQTAPANYVISEKTIQPRATSWNGALVDNTAGSCVVTFKDYVELIEGSEIYQPKTVCLRAVAESGSGMGKAGIRGWSKCVVTGKVSKYR